MHGRPSLAVALVLVVAGCGAADGSPPAIPTLPPTVPSNATAVATSSPLTTPGPTEPDAPLTGTILYSTGDSSDNLHLWTACPDLTRARELHARPGFSAGWAVWSPDGSRIAFNANYDDPDLADDAEIWDIYTMTRDGEDVQRLTRSVGLSGDPGYSADGTLIAFISTEPGRRGVWVMDSADGGNQRLVTPTPEGFVQDFAPRFSPDGTRLVFTRYSSDDASMLWIVDIDGTGLRRLTPHRLLPTKAAWSPDGTAVLFDATSNAFPYQSLWFVRPNGAALRSLNRNSTPGTQDGYSAPAWSPDGTAIMLVHGVYQNQQPVRLGLATIRPDGTGFRPVGDGTGGQNKPDWTATPC